jgi:aspartyl-tRNA(Asn)/glutamyl-tRNA(Gln) amidotransferase subunit A
MLADNVRFCRGLLRPDTAYVWNDMFDPFHNAVKGPYYLVNGPWTDAWEGLDKDVAAAYERALARLSKAGAMLVDLAFEELLEMPGLTIKGGIVAAEAFAQHRDLIVRKGADYDPRVRTRMEAAGGISAAEYLSVVKRREELIRRFSAVTQGLSAVVLPTVMIVPPPIAALAGDQDYLRYNSMSLRNTYMGNFLDCCAISIPVNEPGAAPVGLMLMGVWGQDQRLFSVAQAIESLIP